MADKEKKRKVCTICGMGFVPTSNVQKYCPECREQLNKDGTVKEAYLKYRQARKSGNVVTYKMETPEDMMQQPETPEQPAPPDGWEAWSEEQKNIDLPDGLAVIEEHAEILRSYYKGELVDKSELLAEIREKLGSL